MSKRVLLLSGSPRRGGNSDTLCDQFMLGAQDAGHDVEKLFLRDKKIQYCNGCGACATEKGVGRCPQKDDMAAILDKMIAADVIVMATPTYFYTMNGQMKTLIDRTCSRYTEIIGKEFYFIITAADNDKYAVKRVVEEFRGFLDCLEGSEEKKVISGLGVWQIGDINSSKVMYQAYKCGKEC